MRKTKLARALLSLAIAAGITAPWLALHARGAAAEDATESTAGCHFSAEAGVVNDSATRLTWQQNSVRTLYTWDEAATYCATLDLHGTGWRLPSIKELHTLVDVSKAMPAADPVAFPGMVTQYYWTSSQVANFANEAWAVSFAYGYDGFFDVSTKQHVRCVR